MLTKMLCAVSLLALCSSITACAPTITFSELNTPPHALVKKTENQIQILSIPPSRPFVEVGDVVVVNAGMPIGIDVTDAMKKIAADRGCDAIIFTRHDSYPRAACIVYTE
jgi:hypothetical protein